MTRQGPHRFSANGVHGQPKLGHMVTAGAQDGSEASVPSWARALLKSSAGMGARQRSSVAVVARRRRTPGLPGRLPPARTSQRTRCGGAPLAGASGRTARHRAKKCRVVAVWPGLGWPWAGGAQGQRRPRTVGRAPPTSARWCTSASRASRCARAAARWWPAGRRGPRRRAWQAPAARPSWRPSSPRRR